MWPLGSHNPEQDKKKKTCFVDPSHKDVDRDSEPLTNQEKDPKAQKPTPTSDKSSLSKKKRKKAKSDKDPAPNTEKTSISVHPEVWKTLDA